MPTVCCITTCKGRLAHLRQSLPRLVTQPGFSCVVVDYDCPDGTAAWVEANYPQVRVVRVTGEPGFNASRARNAGASVARAPWLGFFDADILLDPGFADAVLPTLEPGAFYRADHLSRQSWGSIICSRDDFAAVGGYDEAYSGWGGEDDDLVAMLAMTGRRAAAFPARLLGEIAHSDAQRTRFHRVKAYRSSSRVNQSYLRIKLDLQRLLGRPLPLDDRIALYGEVERALITEEGDCRSLPQSVQVNLPASIFHALPQDGMSDVMHLQRRLTYQLDQEGTVPIGKAGTVIHRRECRSP